MFAPSDNRYSYIPVEGATCSIATNDRHRLLLQFNFSYPGILISQPCMFGNKGFILSTGHWFMCI